MRRRTLRRRNKPHRVNPLKRALILGPFQMPIMAYLMYVGVIYLLLAPALGEAAGVTYLWPIYTFASFLSIGAVISLAGRLKSKERWEAFGLSMVVVGLSIATVLEVYIGEYLGLGDNLALLTGCGLRIWVISKARKVERIANSIVMNSKDPEGR